MKNFVLIGAGFGALMILQACASGPPKATAEQCTGTDWKAVGQQHGAAGEPMTTLNTAIKACQVHGIAPDMAAYNAGRAEGLKTYCAPLALIDHTLNGKGDPFACDPMTDAQKKSFEQGRKTRTAVARYQQVQQQVQQLQQQRQQINEEGSRLQAQFNQTTDENVRSQIQARLNQLIQQRNAIDEQLKTAEPTIKSEEAAYQGAVKEYESFKAGLAR